jgi:Cu/Ag efflux pump CusA
MTASITGLGLVPLLLASGPGSKSSARWPSW